MKSAEEFAKHIEWCLLTSSDFKRGNYPCAAKSIRIRDKEIVEACKKAVHAQDSRGHCGRGPAIDDALDDILRDLTDK